MTKIPTQTTPGQERVASPRKTPLEAIRRHCLDCCGFSPKSALWCSCSDCDLWIFRFGRRPESMAPELVTPALFIGPDVNEDDLPNGIEAAAAYLAGRQQTAGGRGNE
jgi:hypothetical protein